MRLDIKINGLERVQSQLDSLSKGQLRGAMVKAVNDVAYEALVPAMVDQMRKVFDRPTQFILKAPRVVPATTGRMYALVEPAWRRGNDVSPQKVLNAQVNGGRRRDKRSEVALRRAGVLPSGWQIAIPDESRGGPFPGSDDGHGNISGPFMIHLLSYLQSFPEPKGKRRNMTAGTKNLLLKRGGEKKKAGGPTLARRYIVSDGRRVGRQPNGVEFTKNLPPGVWAVMGGNGKTIKAVLKFIRPGKGYTPLLDMEAVAKRVDLDEWVSRKMRYHIRQAAGV